MPIGRGLCDNERRGKGEHSGAAGKEEEELEGIGGVVHAAGAVRVHLGHNATCSGRVALFGVGGARSIEQSKSDTRSDRSVDQCCFVSRTEKADPGLGDPDNQASVLLRRIQCRKHRKHGRIHKLRTYCLFICSKGLTGYQW